MPYRRRLPQVEEVPLSEKLIQALQSHFGRVEGWLIKRIKSLPPEKLVEVLDVVPMAESLDYIVNQLPPASEKPVSHTRATRNFNSPNAEESAPFRQGSVGPPRLPTDLSQLDTAIDILHNWREVSSDRNVCFRLKGILGRFPQHPTEASQWLQTLRNHRRRIAPPTPPASDSGTLADITESSSYGSERADEPGASLSIPAAEAAKIISPEEFQPTPEPLFEEKPAMKETPNQPASEGISVEASSDSGPVVGGTEAVHSPGPKPTLSRPGTPGRELHRSHFEIATGPAIEVGMVIVADRLNASEGRWKVSLVLDVPEEEFAHALVEAKRGRIRPLDERTRECLIGFFRDAENPSAAPAAAKSNEGFKPSTGETAPSEVPPTGSASPASGTASPTPARSRRLGGRQEKAGPPELHGLPVETGEPFQDAGAAFSRQFATLTDLIRKEFGSIGKLFDDKAQKWISRARVLNGVPQIESMHLLLSTLANQSGEFIRKAWPLIEKMVENYRAVRVENDKNRQSWEEINQILARLRKVV